MFIETHRKYMQLVRSFAHNSNVGNLGLLCSHALDLVRCMHPRIKISIIKHILVF